MLKSSQEVLLKFSPSYLLTIKIIRGIFMRTIKEPAREVPIKDEFDVIVVGGGPAGIGAAIASARNGARTLIIEESNCLGGLATFGLHLHMSKLTDEGENREIIGGIPKEICQRMLKHK